MIRGVIFDMDGTLFDTERLYTIAWKQVGEEMGYSITTELLNQCRGKTAAIIRGIFEDTFGKEFRYEEASGSSCNFYKTIAWRKSSSNVRNS